MCEKKKFEDLVFIFCTSSEMLFQHKLAKASATKRERARSCRPHTSITTKWVFVYIMSQSSHWLSVQERPIFCLPHTRLQGCISHVSSRAEKENHVTPVYTWQSGPVRQNGCSTTVSWIAQRMIWKCIYSGKILSSHFFLPSIHRGVMIVCRTQSCSDVETKMRLFPDCSRCEREAVLQMSWNQLFRCYEIFSLITGVWRDASQIILNVRIKETDSWSSR